MRAAVLFATVIAAARCGGETTTGLHVPVYFPALMLDQIQFDVTPSGTPPLSARRPDTAGGAWLTSPQDVLVFLPDKAAGRPAFCQATGLARGAVASSPGTASAMLAMHELVPT